MSDVRDDEISDSDDREVPATHSRRPQHTTSRRSDISDMSTTRADNADLPGGANQRLRVIAPDAPPTFTRTAAQALLRILLAVPRARGVYLAVPDSTDLGDLAGVATGGRLIYLLSPIAATALAACRAMLAADGWLVVALVMTPSQVMQATDVQTVTSDDQTTPRLHLLVLNRPCGPP